MAAHYRQRPVSKYVVHPHYADEQEAQIDYQVRIRQAQPAVIAEL